MLEKLNDINWKGLSHAYGAADDVPELIEQLFSKNQAERKEAIHELFGNIYHQETIYEATGYAIPFLIELLENEEVIDRFKIFILIGFIYQGYYREKPSVDAKVEIENRIATLNSYYTSLIRLDKDEFEKAFEFEKDEDDEELDFDFKKLIKEGRIKAYLDNRQLRLFE